MRRLSRCALLMSLSLWLDLGLHLWLDILMLSLRHRLSINFGRVVFDFRFGLRSRLFLDGHGDRLWLWLIFHSRRWSYRPLDRLSFWLGFNLWLGLLCYLLFEFGHWLRDDLRLLSEFSWENRRLGFRKYILLCRGLRQRARYLLGCSDSIEWLCYLLNTLGCLDGLRLLWRVCVGQFVFILELFVYR